MKEYLTYKLEDFVCDESFIHWAKSSDVEHINTWNAWIAKHPEKRELIEDAKDLVLHVKFDEASIEASLEESMWKTIESKTSQKTETNKSSVLRFLPYAIAASIALLLYIGISRQSDFDTNLSTPLAMNSQELLPDESIVDLNAESSLQYDKATWDSNRDVHLKGEAFFSVKKGSTFKVHTEFGTVEVLGTSFNVYARDGVLRVDCETGKVKVRVEGSQETILTPQQSVSYNNGDRKKVNTSIDVKRSNWRRGYYNYNNESLRQAFDDLERQFDIKIISNAAIDELLFNGSFSSKDIDSSLDQILWPHRLEVSNEAKVYTITTSSK